MSGNTFDVTFIDGRRETVTPRLADNVAYSMVWKKRDWPSPTEDQVLLAVFTAFAACRREQKFSGSFEDFQNDVATIDETAPDDDGAPAEPASSSEFGGGFPTMPAPPAMTPAEAPIIADPSAIHAHSTTSHSVTTIPSAGSSRHCR